jgi:circadian clock protein KaiC
MPDTPQTTAGTAKRRTGIQGLDAATHGGLPEAGLTLVLGEAGTGKTVLGLQLLAAAVKRGEAGLLVSFEEAPEPLIQNAMSFRWGPDLRESPHLAVLDGRPQRDSQATGRFDVQGLIALLDSQASQLGASWIVLDGIDQLLRLQPDEAAAVEEVQRLDDWCRARGLTAVLTAKRTESGTTSAAYLAGVEFMLSTILVLSGELVERRLNRRFRIMKYRGTAHVTDELPVVMDSEGLNLPSASAFASVAGAEVAPERVSSGVPRLDDLLDGGYYLGSSVLVSGAPGTSKTTLGGAFVAAAAARGESAMMVSFDEPEGQIVRNLNSVGLDLAPLVEAGGLRIVARSPWSALVEEHFMALLDLIDRHQPTCLVLDPVSALLKGASGESPFQMVERLLGIAKARGITCFLSSLTEREQAAEATTSHVSTIADTWISLDYRAHGGERNRALSIVKSRGSAHSNQVRELLLSADGIDLADVFEYGSEVLMGTARVQKETEEAQARRRERLERQRRRSELEQRLKQVEARIAEAQSEKEHLRAEIELEDEGEREADAISNRHQQDIRQHRVPGHSKPEGGGKAS